MESIDKIYVTELNFIDENGFSRNGMIREIKMEFDIIRLCIYEKNRLGEEYSSMLNKIVIMPLRKLLCENKTILMKVCPDFKMPHLIGNAVVISGDLTIIRPPFKVEPIEQWISIDEWLKQEISWFTRDINSMAKIIPKFSYDCIMKKLNKKEFKLFKTRFESLYHIKKVKFKDEIMEVYCKNNPDDQMANKEIYDILDQIGYNRLSIYELLKHLSDKSGAHIDVDHSLAIGMINDVDASGYTPVEYFAMEMIYSAKKQIQELDDYWVDMPELTE